MAIVARIARISLGLAALGIAALVNGADLARRARLDETVAGAAGTRGLIVLTRGSCDTEGRDTGVARGGSLAPNEGS